MQKDAAGSGRRVSVSDPGNGSHAGSYPHAWNPSYCAVTVSDRSREQVSAYIEGQKEKEKRKP